MRPMNLIVVLCLAGLVLGCGAGKPATTAAPTGGASMGPGSVPGLTLLEPGAAPQSTLRYALVAAPQTAVLDIALRVEGPRGDVASPTVRFTLSAAPGAAQGEEIPYVAQIVSTELLQDAELAPALREQLSTELATYVGLKVEAVTTSRGLAKEALFELPDSVGEHIELVMDTLQASLGTLAVPFPEEAVGVGGKWQVVSEVAGAIRATRTATYTLVALTDSSATIEIGLAFAAEPQALPLRGRKAGAQHQLLSYEGQGSGRATVRFTELLPGSAVSFGVRSAVKITRPNSEQTVNTSVHFDLSLSGQNTK